MMSPVVWKIVYESLHGFYKSARECVSPDLVEDTRKVVRDSISTHYSIIFDQLGPFSPLSVRQYIPNFSSISSKFDDRIIDVDKTAAKIVKTKEEIDAALKATREAAGEQGVATSAKYFGESASDYTAAGYFWLVIVFGIIIGSVVVVAHNLGGLIKDGEHIWDNSALLLSLLMAILALAFASKAYRFNKHNQVVNEHRQNALKVFQAINAAAGDDRELKAIVLTAAANCMFAPQDSGYAKNAPNAEQPIGVMDMLARIIHK